MTNNPLEQIPPHDVESEATVLGCLFSPRVAKLILPRLEEADFYYPQHRQIFAAMHHLILSTGVLDEKLVCDELSIRHNGDWYDAVAFCAGKNTPAVESHVQVLKDRRAERDVQLIAQKVLQSIALKQGEKVIADAQAAFAALKVKASSEVVDFDAEAMGPDDLMSFDTSNDPDNMFGTRWLCRGGSLTLVGQTGVGKSSFIMQGSIQWALNQPFFGIIPAQRMKTLIVQSENDKGDLAEEFQGIIKGLSLEAEWGQVRPMIRVVRECCRIGEAFIKTLEARILHHKPDICWLDPLKAFAGGSISDQENMTAFLRAGLAPIMLRTGVIIAIVNHTPKPSKDPKKRNGFIGGDFSYSGFGSAEIPDFTRETLTLSEVEDGIYQLRGGKRRERCGLHDPKYLRRADPGQGIYWAETTFQTLSGSDLRGQYEDVLKEIHEPLKCHDIIKLIRRVLGGSDSTAYRHRRAMARAGLIRYFPSTGLYSSTK